MVINFFLLPQRVAEYSIDCEPGELISNYYRPQWLSSTMLSGQPAVKSAAAWNLSDNTAESISLLKSMLIILKVSRKAAP